MADRHYRSLVKALSWRLTGSLDTMLIAYLITGQMKWAATISGVELFTKVFLFYMHERLWEKIALGRPPEKPDYSI
jgi:uncharacterized membrane protein